MRCSWNTTLLFDRWIGTLSFVFFHRTDNNPLLEFGLCCVIDLSHMTYDIDTSVLTRNVLDDYLTTNMLFCTNLKPWVWSKECQLHIFCFIHHKYLDSKLYALCFLLLDALKKLFCFILFDYFQVFMQKLNCLIFCDHLYPPIFFHWLNFFLVIY